METIIGLLVIVLPLVFKVIEKKLQQSADSLPGVEVPETEVQDVEAMEVKVPENKPAARRNDKLHIKPKVLKRDESKVIVPKEKIDSKEKIDPRKLVIYSEIMRPKYKD